MVTSLDELGRLLMVEMGVHWDQIMRWLWEYCSCLFSEALMEKGRQSVVSWIGSQTLKVSPNHQPEFFECAQLNVKLLLQVGLYLILHLVDLLKCEHTWLMMYQEAIMNMEMKRLDLWELQVMDL